MQGKALQPWERHNIRRLKMQGLTYQEVADASGVIVKTVSKFCSPPQEIQDSVIARAHSKCEICGRPEGDKGIIHHKGAKSTWEEYSSAGNLQFLCRSCHSAFMLGERMSVICETCFEPFTMRKDYYVSYLKAGNGIFPWRCKRCQSRQLVGV